MSLHPDGLWYMWCFNALSQEQRTMVVEKGYLPIGWEPDQNDCDQPAAVEIETKYDQYPGPRFYCIPCAIKYLDSMKGDK